MGFVKCSFTCLTNPLVNFCIVDIFVYLITINSLLWRTHSDRSSLVWDKHAGTQDGLWRHVHMFKFTVYRVRLGPPYLTSTKCWTSSGMVLERRHSSAHRSKPRSCVRLVVFWGGRGEGEVCVNRLRNR